MMFDIHPTKSPAEGIMTKEDIVQEFHDNALGQQNAVQQLMTLGLTAPDAYVALGIIKQDASSTHSDLLSEVPSHVEKIQAFASNPIVLAELKKLDSLSPADKQKEAQTFVANFSDPTFLTQLGLDPTDRRLCLRIFEKPFNTAQVLDSAAVAGTLPVASELTLAGSPNPLLTAATTVCGSIGYVACVTIGKEY
jgi:hypothetical protein